MIWSDLSNHHGGRSTMPMRIATPDLDASLRRSLSSPSYDRSYRHISLSAPQLDANKEESYAYAPPGWLAGRLQYVFACTASRFASPMAESKCLFILDGR
jgi:hypothetical protein